MQEFLQRFFARLTMVLSVSMAPAAGAAENVNPAFTDHPVSEVSDQVLRAIDFDSEPNARNFRTRLEYMLDEPVNFAGHYILTYWGCGTGCQSIAVIDVLDGSVAFPLASSYGMCYRADSELLIVNPMDEFFLEGFDGLPPDWLQTGYYLWEDGEMKLLQKNQAPVTEDCPVD